MLSFVQLTSDDALLLTEIGGASLLESHGHSAPAAVMQQYVDMHFNQEACRGELQDENNLFTGIFYKGQPAGYSKIILNIPCPDISLQPVTKLERLYLLKKFYALKLGFALLQHTITLSKAAGDKGMWLDVWTENHRAIRFYQRQDFETVGEGKFVLSSGHTNPVWIMLRRYPKA